MEEINIKPHEEKVAKIQEQMQSFFAQRALSERPTSISLKYSTGNSNTTRSKSYKKGSQKLDFKDLNEIIKIDPQKQIAIVEPRVTMEELVQATLPYGLIPAVVPEFKGITVGGAIMGGAGESSSHHFGGFHDICLSFEILCGNGEIVRASPNENADLFYGVPCSYGSLGILLSTEIRLIPVQKDVFLHYHVCPSLKEAIQTLQSLAHAPSPPDFLDGIVFSKNVAVVIEGSLQSKQRGNQPRFSVDHLSSEWYFQHVEKIASQGHKSHTEVMSVPEYLFRYDQGAFWVGAYLFQPGFLARFILQGILKLSKPFQENFTESEIQKLHSPPRPNIFWRTLTHPIMTSQNLWKLQHKAEKWVHTHAIVQDFCIPEERALPFLEEVATAPGTFPLWLCPIQCTRQPQIFAPHFTKSASSTHVINVGIYGLPAYFTPIEKITKELEQKTKMAGGRKVLYSRSYYTEEEFWEIYSQPSYNALRAKTFSDGVLRKITDKVLSE